MDPNVALNNQARCKKRMGSFCLDHTSLTVAAAEVIIAIGCLFIIVLVAIPCVWLEWHRKSGQASFALLSQPVLLLYLREVSRRTDLVSSSSQ